MLIDRFQDKISAVTSFFIYNNILIRKFMRLFFADIAQGKVKVKVVPTHLNRFYTNTSPKTLNNCFEDGQA